MSELKVSITYKENHDPSFELKPGQSRHCPFVVHNDTGSGVSLKVRALGEAEDWIQLDKDGVNLADKGQDDVTATVAVPAGANPGSRTFKLQVYRERDPSEASSSGDVEVIVPEERKDKRWWQKPWFIAAASTAGTIAIALIVYLMWPDPKVPDVRNLTLEAAIDTLAKVDLRVNEAVEKITGTHTAGRVVSQDPSAGQPLPENKLVNLVLEAETVTVPPLVGKTLAQATTLLNQARLVVGSRTPRTTQSSPTGHIISQDPAANAQVLAQTPVNVVIAKQPQPPPALNGDYTIQQKSNNRYVDAHEHQGEDFRLVTRPNQSNNTQRWRFTSAGKDLYRIQQKSNNRYVDAHEHQGEDFRLVTRPTQPNNTQIWIVKKIGANLYTMQQKSNNRYVDAHEHAGEDFRLVTRPWQNNDTQRWIIKRP